jgi:hypothetical protein
MSLGRAFSGLPKKTIPVSLSPAWAILLDAFFRKEK